MGYSLSRQLTPIVDHDFVEQMEIARRIMREDRNILKVLAK